MSHKETVRNANWTVKHLKNIFDQMGGLDRPRTGIYAAYRQAHRALRDVIRRQRLVEISEVLYFLQENVRFIEDRLLQQAANLGEASATVQLKNYKLSAASPPVIDLTQWEREWLRVTETQISKAQALIVASGDPTLLIGDKNRQGIIRPQPVITEGTFVLATVAALTFNVFVKTTAERREVEFLRQAIAAIDSRTTECCLGVHGQIVKMDEPFTLTGTPRFADKIMSPPFHWNCRTSQALVRLQDVGDDLTVALRDAARGEEQRREEREPETPGPKSALGG